MSTFTSLDAVRIVGAPEALDLLSKTVSASVSALRLAPDDLMLVGAKALPVCADEHAIIEFETGYSGRWFTRFEFASIMQRHLEWSLPETHLVGQGLVAGVPAKVHSDGDLILMICATVHVHELEDRLR
jgi:hypothetical protein